MTKALIDYGAKVYILGRREATLKEAARYSPNIVPVVADVTSKDSLIRAAALIKKETGFINVLICNSGIAATPVDQATESASELARRALARDPEEWSTVFATNITAIYFTSMSFLELLDAGNKKSTTANRTSQILVTSSNAGYLRIPRQLGPYPVSKAAVTHLVKMMSGSLAPFDIRVNAIAPGLFPSDMASGLIASTAPGAADPTADDVVSASTIPARRIGRETDMAGSIIYMVSAAGAYLNGTINVVDGGRLSQVPSTY